MIGYNMPYLNKFVIRKTLSDYMSPQAQREFRANIVREFLAQCPNTFYKAKIPVTMNILLRYKHNVLAKYPRLDLVANLFIEALHGYAYDTGSQITSIIITKEKSTTEDIVITLTDMV